MVDCTRMNNLVLVALLLSFVCDNAASFGTPKTPCSWGAWSQWNCTCCGNSIDQPVYRVRTKCCSGTFACGNLRIMAEYITSSGTNFQEEGKCSKDCPITDFKKHNSNSCSSAVDQTLLLAKPALCQDVCIGSLTTTKSSLPSRTQPPYTTITHRDSTRVTAADVRSSTDIPSNSSRDTVPPETTNDRNRRSPTTTKRDSTRVTDIPPKSSHDTIQAEKVTTMPIVKSGKNLASRVSSHLVLWIAAVSTTVLCLLDLIPI